MWQNITFLLWKDYVSFVKNTIAEDSLKNVEALPPDRFSPLKFPSTKMDIYLNSLPYTGCRESYRIYPPGVSASAFSSDTPVSESEESLTTSSRSTSLSLTSWVVRLLNCVPCVVARADSKMQSSEVK